MRSAAILAVALAAVPAAAWACRCAGLSPAAAYRVADAVALVQVESFSDRERMARSYHLRVAESWKRRLPARIVVRSIRTDCLAELRPGSRYLVYLEGGRDGFKTEACSGNQPAERAGAALAALRRGRA